MITFTPAVPAQAEVPAKLVASISSLSVTVQGDTVPATKLSVAIGNEAPFVVPMAPTQTVNIVVGSTSVTDNISVTAVQNNTGPINVTASVDGGPSTGGQF